MSKARDLADLVSAGSVLEDGTVEVADISDLTATATELNYLDITTLGTVEASKAVTADSSSNVTLPDDIKFIFGAGSDLQIFHRTTPIEDDRIVSTGNLTVIGADTLVSGTDSTTITSSAGYIQMGSVADPDDIQLRSTSGEITLQVGASNIMSATSSGIDVTGTAEMDTLSIGGTAVTATAAELNYVDGATSNIQTQINALQTSFATNVITSNTTASANNHYYINGSAITLTLPLSPSVGDEVRLSEVAGNTDNIVGRNGSNIMSAAEDLTIDSAYLVLSLRYVDATIGWAFS